MDKNGIVYMYLNAEIFPVQSEIPVGTSIKIFWKKKTKKSGICTALLYLLKSKTITLELSENKKHL